MEYQVLTPNAHSRKGDFTEMKNKEEASTEPRRTNSVRRGSSGASKAVLRSVKSPKVAIVCDWLTNMGGAEKVVLALAKAYPNAPIYTSVFTPETMPAFKGLDVRTTYLQKLPGFLRKRHQLFPTARARAFRKLDLSEYDIIISSSSAEAKAVQKRPGALHICYCHTPTRYYWSHYEEYKREPGMGPLNPLVRLVLPLIVRRMRAIDLRAAAGVDAFIANSKTVAERIKRYYGRDSYILNPPVDTSRFAKLDITGKRQGFIALGRQVPYKRIDLAVQACTRLNKKLTVYGTGSEHQRLIDLAGPTIEFITDADDIDVARALTRAEAYLMPQEEDFGIVQIEAMAAGTPVIAYGRGGSRDAVIEGKTGTFFDEQTVSSLAKAIAAFSPKAFKPKEIQKHAASFSGEQFIRALHAFVAKQLK